MITLDIRNRILLVAVLPVVIVGMVLSAVFLGSRIGDLEETHLKRSQSLVRQLAISSEYGIFSGSLESLRSAVSGLQSEADVEYVAIIDSSGIELFQSGGIAPIKMPLLGSKELLFRDQASGSDVMVMPVTSKPVVLSDLEMGPNTGVYPEPKTLGHVVLVINRASVLKRERELLVVGLLTSLGGLALGVILAVRLSRGVIQPIERISGLVERVRKGDLSQRLRFEETDPLVDLQKGLNQMVQSIEQGRGLLVQRIDEATKELREKKEEAETATLAKSRFLASASHDLRQPIHALGMFVSRLGQLEHEPQARQLMGSLASSVDAIQNLLDSLLDISKLDANAVNVQLQPFPLMEVLEGLRNSLLPIATAKGLKFRVRPTQAWVLSDPVLLHRILLNLLSNALRYTDKGGVLLGCRTAGREVRIDVIDTGIGIAKDEQTLIFREFYQIANPERDRTKGLGLGLNIVQRTAKLLDCKLEMRSSQGFGSRFSVFIQRSQEVARPVLKPFDEALSLHHFTGIKVLVIEDDDLVANALEILLQSWGCETKHVEGVEDGLPLLQSGWRPTIILSDYRLRNNESGIDAVYQMQRAMEEDVPACLMSGDTDVRLIEAAREAKLTLLHKPVRPAKLRSLMRNLLQPEA